MKTLSSAALPKPSVGTTGNFKEKIGKISKSGNLRLDLGIRYLIPEWKRMLNPAGLGADITSGLTVACIAIPLSLAIALASHVSPATGLITAIVAGIVCALTNGTSLAVSGPAAAMAVLIASNVDQHGLGGLLAIGFICGLLQLGCGVFGLGSLVKFIPMPVIAGFTAGIGALISIGQLPNALGLPAAPSGKVFAVLAHSITNLPHAHLSAIGITVLTIAIIKLLPKVAPKAPAPLVGVGFATALCWIAGIDVKLIGAIPRSLPLPQMPAIPLDALPDLTASAFVVFALASLETLLSSSSVDKQAKTRHDSNQELIGQGMGNMVVSLFGGIPVTGVIARSSVNVAAGAKTRRSAIIHSLALIATVLVFAPVMGRIPVAALAAVLIATAMKMMDPSELRLLWRVSKSESAVYLITFAVILAVDLIAGVQAGMLVAVGIAVFSMGRAQLMSHQSDCAEHNLFSFSGPLSFLASSRFDDLRKYSEQLSPEQNLILDLSGVTAVDSSGAAMLLDFVSDSAAQNRKVVLQGLPNAFHSTIEALDHEGALNNRHAFLESETHSLLDSAKPADPRERLVFGVKRFHRETKARYQGVMEKLSNSQAPHTLFITCCDSRIVPSLLTSTEPGELFILRNIGNVVMPLGSDELPSEGAAVEYAVGVLGVRQIIVCGHSGCGAMKAAFGGVDEKQFPSVAAWLKGAQELRARTPGLASPEELARQNVVAQFESLRTYPAVRQKLDDGALTVRGWFYDLQGLDVLEWNGQEFTHVAHS